MKKQMCMITGILLSLMLTACSNPAEPSVGTETPSEPTVSSTAVASQQTERKKLMIGLSDQLKEVPYDGEDTPESLIAALAEETGWNLTLANPLTTGLDENSLTVAFAADSAIYTAPDGGNLDENSGCSLYLTPLYPWNEVAVRMTNEPLPEDSVGLVMFDPLGETCAGFENLNLLFMRDDVHAGTGTGVWTKSWTL